MVFVYTGSDGSSVDSCIAYMPIYIGKMWVVTPANGWSHGKWKVVLEESAIYYHASGCTSVDPGNIAVPSSDRSRFD